jgi:CDP-glycerol glycerophosphotransferase
VSFLRVTAKSFALGILRRMPRLRRVARKVVWRLKRFRYEWLTRGVALEPYTILFESYGGRSYTCSPKALFEALCEDRRFDGWRFIWSFKEPEEKESKNEAASLLKTRATLVKRMSKEYLRACACATYWITNNRVPEFLRPKPGQTYVQCWHGTPLKRLGFDVAVDARAALNTASELAERFAIDAEKWTWLLSPSPYASEHLTSAFGRGASRQSLVIEEGYPRNDALVTTLRSPEAFEAIQAVRRRFGISPKKRVLLYAPTWRDDSYQAGVGYTQNVLLNFDALQRELGTDWVVLLRAHYYIANRLDVEQWQDFVYDVSRVEDVNDLYVASDALLTDYSSVFFDYANTTRPLLFYWPDLNHYEDKVRGFYFDPASLPGPKCRTSEEVATALGDIDNWNARYGHAYEAFRQEFCPKDDGNATKRVIERLFGR